MAKDVLIPLEKRRIRVPVLRSIFVDAEGGRGTINMDLTVPKFIFFVIL